MKYGKTILFSFLFVLVAVFSASAQGIFLIPRGGINMSNLAGKYSPDGETLTSPVMTQTTSSKDRFSFGAVYGMGIEYELSEGFGFQTDILFSQMGERSTVTTLTSTDSEISVSEYSYKTNLHYLQLPLLFKIKFGNEQVGGFVNFGPSFSYLRSGSLQSDDESIDLSFNKAKNYSNGGDMYQAHYNRLEVGAILGAGFTYVAGPGVLFAELRFTRSFTSLYYMDEQLKEDFNDTDMQRPYNQALSFQIGYALRITKKPE